MFRFRLIAAALPASVATLVVLWSTVTGPRVQTMSGTAPAASAADALPVNGSAPLLPPEILRLSGDVTGLPQGVSPTVVVRVNGVPVPSQVSGASYVADIVAPPSAMVSIDAHAPRVLYRSILGSVGGLARHAGGDALVTVDDYQAMRVSPWSTAITALSERLLGRAARDDDDLAQVRRMLASPDAWQSFASSNTEHELGAMAEAMLRYADGRLALPTGKATGYDAVSDAAVFAAEVSKVASLARDFVVRAGHRQRIPALESLPAKLLLASKAGPADSVVASRHTLLVTRTGPGRVRVDASEFSDALQLDGSVMPGTPMPEFDAVITAEGDLRLVPRARVVWTVTADYARADVELEALELRRLAEGSISLWGLALDTRTSHVSRPDLGLVARRQWSVLWGGDLDLLARPVSWSTNVALRTHCLQVATAPAGGRALKGCEAVELLLLADGQGRMEDTGWKVDSTMRPRVAAASALPFAWSLHDGGKRLRVQLPAIATDVWIIGGGDTATDLMLVRSSGTASDVAAQSLLAMSTAVTGGFVGIDTASAWGHWRLAPSYVDYLYPTPYRPSYLVRRADGLSSEYLDPQGLAGNAVASAWESYSSRLYDTRYRARYPGSSQVRTVAGCAQAFAEGATECAPFRVRYFKPMARLGNRIYGYTDFYYNSQLYPAGYTGTYSIVRSGGGVTFYDCEEGGCLNVAAAALESQPGGPIRTGAQSRNYDDAHLRLRVRGLRP